MKVKLNPKQLSRLGQACPPGQILREGYTRKGYTRKDGVRVKSTRVPPACVVDRGAPGKTPEAKKWAKEIPELQGGVRPTLGKKDFIPGWEAKDPASERREAIRKLSTKQGCRTVRRKLMVVHNLNYRQNPPVAAKARADHDWAGEQGWCKLKRKEKK